MRQSPSEFLPEGWRVQGERGIVFVIAGPSGVGKTSVIARVLRRDPILSFSVSVTTRPKRPGEVEGRDYHFLTEEEFNRMMATGELLEWTVYQGHRYGTPRREVVDRLSSGRDVIMKLEMNGALALKRALSPVVLIFLIPPSEEELERRIKARGTESEEARRERLAIAAEEITHIPEFHYLVVNAELEQAAAEVAAIIQAERCRLVPW